MQKCENLVELEKRCKMSIWSQKSALIQRRTDCLKLNLNRAEARSDLRPVRELPLGRFPSCCGSLFRSPHVSRRHAEAAGPRTPSARTCPFSAATTPMFATKIRSVKLFSISKGCSHFCTARNFEVKTKILIYHFRNFKKCSLTCSQLVHNYVFFHIENLKKSSRSTKERRKGSSWSQ